MKVGGPEGGDCGNVGDVVVDLIVLGCGTLQTVRMTRERNDGEIGLPAPDGSDSSTSTPVPETWIK